MEPAVYRVLQELHRIIVGDGKSIMSNRDIALLEASLQTLLTVYAPEPPADGFIPHDVGEARRPPQRPTKKEHWWNKLSI